MTKYVLRTEHRAGFDREDKIISLESQDLLFAILESEDFCKDDDNLYCVCLYESLAKNEYRQCMESSDGRNFHVKFSNGYLTRSTHKVNGKTCESFEIHPY